MGDVVALSRSPGWRAESGAPPARARTENIRRLSKTTLKRDAELYPYPTDIERPVVRGDCLPGGSNAERPCPFVSCHYHIALDVHPVRGSIKENFPGRELEDLIDTCVLDAADRDGLTLEAVAARMNLTRERTRQVIDAVLAEREDELLAIAADNDIDLGAVAQRVVTREPKPEPAQLPDVDREALLEAARAAGAARGPAPGALVHEPKPAPKKRRALLVTTAPADPIPTRQPPPVRMAVTVIEPSRKTPVARRDVKCAREGCENRFPLIARRRFCSEACHDLAAEERRRTRRVAALGRPSLRDQRRTCKGCPNEFTPRFGNERYCEACRGVVPMHNRTKETRVTQLPTIDCEHNLGTMQTRMCGRRWARANGLPVVNSFTRSFEQSLSTTPCVGCVYGEARIHNADRIPNAVRTAPVPARAFPPPPPAAVPAAPLAAAPELPPPKKLCACGKPILRKAGTVGRLPDRCIDCREPPTQRAAVAQPLAPAELPSATRSRPGQTLTDRIVPALDAIKQDVAHLQVELDRLKAGANTLASVASMPPPYPEVA